MNFSLLTTLEAIVLVVALSTDAFVASFAYGSNKIKIPFLSAQIINIVCSFILGFSLLIGNTIRQYIPVGWTPIICFGILFILGIIKLLDSTIKSFIKKHGNLKHKIKFSMFSVHFILQVYATPEEADRDYSKILTAGAAVSLAIALSLDGLAVGFGAALGEINVLQVVLFSLIFGTIAVQLGCWIGNKVAEKIPFNLEWLSGVLLIILAFLKW